MRKKRTEVTEELFDRIRACVKKHPGLSQDEIGLLTGVSGSTVCRVMQCDAWENYHEDRRRRDAELEERRCDPLQEGVLEGQMSIDDALQTLEAGDGTLYEEAHTQGRKGERLLRINLGFTPEVYQYIRVMATLRGESFTGFVNRVMEQSMTDNRDLYGKAQELAAQFR